MSVAEKTDEIQSLEKNNLSVLTQANSIVVKTAEQEGAAIEFIRGLKDLRQKVVDTFGPMKSKAHAAWKEVVAQENKHMEPLDAAEKTIRGKIIGFQAEQERLRKAEEARLNELAQKEQQKRIDAAGKRVNALLEKSSDVAGQIAGLEAELQLDGLNEEDRAAIESRIDMLRLKQDSLNRAVTAKQAEAEMAQYIAPVIAVAPAPKAQGTSSLVKKKAVVNDLMALIKGVATGAVSISVLDPNMSVLDKLMAAGAVVPGVGFTEERILRVRR